MTTIAVTGHMALAVETTGPVREAPRGLPSGLAGDGLAGHLCLAAAQGSLFAGEFLALRGRLSVIIPKRPTAACRTERPAW
ncbi:hypothetical protein AB0D04_05515 [Streptomyces sp. NPDC048483]|uniref:hypothetical protein n=1 Tax=Streptomyces sp. NPDC048483 TaxID=3154927 RepID=UPI00341EDDE6